MPTSADENSDVWTVQAAQWERVGPPLRPSAADLAHPARVAAAWAASRGVPPRVLLLGVTPELALLEWPHATQLLAVDRCANMIRQVWPGVAGPGRTVLRADWLQLPLAPRTRDLVVSDGCFGVIRYEQEYRVLLRRIRDVLGEDGRFVFRVFVRPEPSETGADVYAAVMRGEIGSFHAFKLRLLMALQPSSAAGVRIGDVWESWFAEGPRPAELAAKRGWPAQQIATIEAYRDQDTVYCFPALSELRALIGEEGWEEIECVRPNYELGDRCLTLVLSPG